MGRIWGCRRARCPTSAYFTEHDALRSRTKRMLGQRATCSIKRQTLQLVPILTKQIEGAVWGAVQRGWQSAWWPSGSSAEHDDIRTRGKPRQLDRAPSAKALLTAHSQAALCDDLASSLPLTAIDREALECAPPVRSVSAGCTMVRTRNRP